jgi:Zn-dependent peptidase ImmA (M78 family)
MNKKQIKRVALEALKRYHEKGNELFLPVPIKKICKSYKNIRLISYSKYMANHGITLSEMYDIAGSKDAVTDCLVDLNRYIIYYNDVDKSIVKSYRYRWNIAHELGHILLKHHSNKKTRLFRNQLNNAEYKQLEREADWFASYILVPHSVISEVIHDNDKLDIKEICKVSSGATKYRQEDFLEWSKMNIQYNDYDRKLLDIFEYQHYCRNCHSLLPKHFVSCPICGSIQELVRYYKNSYRKLENVMKYEELDNTNGVLNVCPHCQNEEIIKNTLYCHICGTMIVNKCCNSFDAQGVPIQCQDAELEPIPVNARYCPYCGSKTIFLHNNILKEWNDISDKTNFGDLPF